MPYLQIRREFMYEAHRATVNCAFAFCNDHPRPHPDANAAEGLADDDPNQRDPNAVLNDYNQRLHIETTLGIIFVVCVVCVAIGLWIGFDKNLRKRMRRWASAVKTFATCRSHAPEDDNVQPPSRLIPRANSTVHARQAGATMPLGPERVMRIMPSVLEARTASTSTEGGSLSEKKTVEGVENLSILKSAV